MTVPARFAILAAVLAAPLAVWALAAAQDPVKVAPASFKVLLENDQVRVLESAAKTGQTIPMHSHPDHVLYFLKGGKARFTGADGKTQDLVSKPGEAVWSPAGSHSTQVLSDSHVILIELKPGARK